MVHKGANLVSPDKPVRPGWVTPMDGPPVHTYQYDQFIYDFHLTDDNEYVYNMP